MTIFQNLSESQENSIRAQLIAQFGGKLMMQSYADSRGKVYARVYFVEQLNQRVFFDDGAIHHAVYKNAKTGKISGILAHVAHTGYHEKSTVLGAGKQHGRLHVTGYLNDELIYKQEWQYRYSSNAEQGFMSIDAALAMCVRSLEDKMKNLAKGELSNE